MSMLFSKAEKGKVVLIENGFDCIGQHTHEKKIHKVTNRNVKLCCTQFLTEFVIELAMTMMLQIQV